MISHACTARPPHARGFTLIELLTVIAIIAILAGLLFPVFKGVRDQAQKSNCMSNLHTILQALQMYKDDWRVYPDALYGYVPVAPGANPCASASVANARYRLFLPDYVKDEGVFTCPNSPVKRNPNNLTYVDAVNRSMSDSAVHTSNPAGGPGTWQFCYPSFDSYDFQFRPANVAGGRELRYNRRWTMALEQAGGLNFATLPRRQLAFRTPPDTTVVTSCTYHNVFDGQGSLQRGGMALVAFLSGRVQAIPAERATDWTQCRSAAGLSSTSSTCAWLASPKP